VLPADAGAAPSAPPPTAPNHSVQLAVPPALPAAWSQCQIHKHRAQHLGLPLGLLSLGRGSMQWPLLSRLSPSPAGTSLYRSSELLSACCSPLAHPAVQPVFGRWRDRRDRVCVPGFRVCRRRYKGCPQVLAPALRACSLSPAAVTPGPTCGLGRGGLCFCLLRCNEGPNRRDCCRVRCATRTRA
jgi:hypothetical protein